MIPNNISHRFAATPLLATVVIFLVALFGASMHSAQAQTATNTWTGAATGNAAARAAWTSANNWGGTAPIAGSVLVFAGTAKTNANTNDFAAGTGFFSISFATNAGTFILTGANISLTNGITNNSTNTQTLNLNGITLGAAQTFNALSNNLIFTTLNNITNGGFLLTIDGAFTTTFNSIISGTGGLTKTGAGTLILSNANTYTGTTTVSAGTLQYGAANALSSGAVTVNGSTAVFNIGTFSDTVGAVTLTDGSITGTTGVLSGSSYSVVNGSITAALGGTAAAMSKTGAGTVTLGNATNSYGGTTTIGGGVLNVGSLAAAGANSSIGTNATIIITNGGVLNYSGATVSINRGISLASGNGGIGVSNSAAALTISGVLSNTGTLVKSGAGTLILSASNTYSGGTLLNAGTLAAGNAFAFGTGSITLTNGTFLNLSNFSIANTLVNNGGTLTNVGTVSGAQLDAGTTSLSGTNSTVATVSGTATVDVSGANTTITNMTGGTVNIAATSTNSTLQTVSGGTINASTNIAVTTYNGGNISNSSAVTINSGSSAGSISGAGNLIKAGSGTLTLSGNNTFTGTTTIGTGTLQVGNGGTSGTLGAGNVTNNAALVFNRSDTATVSNTISGSGMVTKEGAGTLILTANNSYAGGFVLNGNGAVRAQSSGALGSGLVQQASGSSKIIIDTTGNITNQMSIFNIATLQTVTLSGAKTLNNATYDVTNNTTTTESGTLTGAGGITKIGAGTLVVTASNTFIGAVDVQAGLLNLNSSTGFAAGSTTAVSVASGATLLVSQNNQVNNAATVSLSGGTIRTAVGVAEVFGNLNVSSASFLDFGAAPGNPGSMSFGTYTPSALLTINNFNALSTLVFKSDLSSSITNSSLFAFNNGGINSYSWDSNTSTFTITAVPEPSTYFAATGLLAVFLWPSRKRILRYAKRTLGLRAPTRDRLAARQA